MNLTYMDRSRIDTYQRCHRRAYWEYYYGGRGLRKARANLDILIGTATHKGLAALLTGKTQPESTSEALKAFDEVAATTGLDVITEDEFYVAQEAKALIEGMLVLFSLNHRGTLLTDYEVLEVEEEDTTYLTDDIIWMSRTDAVLRSRQEHDLHILSFKTTSSWDSRKDKAANTDIQGLSEAYAVEARYKEKVMGIQMVHLLKGRKAEDSTGRYIRYSPLIRGYRRFGPGGVEFAHSWEWTDPATGAKRRLGGKWERFDVWTEYEGGVSQWVADCMSGRVQPDAIDRIAEQIVMPYPYSRNQQDMDSWIRQTRAEAGRLQDRTAKPPDPASWELDVYFPQYRHSCHYPSDCPFIDLCYGGKDVRETPLENGYVWRQPNHPIEETVLPPIES